MVSSYRVAWVSVTALVVGAASVYDVAAGGLVRMVSVGLGFGLLGGFLAFTLAEERADGRAWVRRSALWTGLAAMAADALATSWGNPGLLVGVVLLATTPAAVSFASDRFVSWSSRRTSGRPDAMSMRDLQRRWDWTTSEVLRPRTTVSRRLVLVQERHRLLDELQLRDPAHFDVWLGKALADRHRAGRWSPGP
jgi:hypothetical protein